MISTIFNLAELPQGYFRIHWPQSQVLMDDKEYQNDVILCMGETIMFNLSTIALPNRYKRLLDDETRTYVEYINSPRNFKEMSLDEFQTPDPFDPGYHPLLDPQDPFLEDNQDPDLGGTGHGDISHSDADEGL